MDKFDDNCEDNCVEIDQKLEIEVPVWITTWAKFLLKQYLNLDKLDEQSVNSIEKILMASTRGESCISIDDIQISSLSTLISNDLQAEQEATPFVHDDQYVYLYRYWQLEQRLALQVARLYRQKITSINIENFENLLIDPHQKQALSMVAHQAFNMITGGPGTGKTYTLARIIAALNHSIQNLRIAMAAPTGKAAQRMKEALQNSLNDSAMLEMGFDLERLKQQETLTIHRLLGLGNSVKPKHHAQNPLPYDVIVIDEASMLDLNLATLLLEATPKQCRLILLGDANQLASVDVGSVLADLQKVKELEKNQVNLVTSRRFRKGALIGEMAQFIQNLDLNYLPESPEDLLLEFEKTICSASTLKSVELTSGMDDFIQLEYLPDGTNDRNSNAYYEKLSYGFHGYFQALKNYIDKGYPIDSVSEIINRFDDYRILVAVSHGALGRIRLNQEIEKQLFDTLKFAGQQLWYVGRPVMMTYNDYQLGLSNGDIGICFRHRQFPGQFEVYFPSLNQWFPTSRLPKSMETCFALSIHKSQGSEFWHAAVVLDQSATRLLSQELIYTAITRAKTVVSLLVHPFAFDQALRVKTLRKSGLLNKLNSLVISVD